VVDPKNPPRTIFPQNHPSNLVDNYIVCVL
jgi:hypothetical protein